MNNEPVAWLRYENEHWRLDFPMVRFYTNVETPEIPLYTAPELARKLHTTKTLTDDAIRYQWLRNEYAHGRETYLAEGMPSGEKLDEYIDEQLRKAQEK